MASAKYKVTGMSCGHCRQKVERALKGITGVYSAVVDLQDGVAEVDFDDDAVTSQQLVTAVERAGYAARLVG
jgi:copper chaperone